MIEWIKNNITLQQLSIAGLVACIFATLSFAALFIFIIKNNEHRIIKNDGKYVEKVLNRTSSYMAKRGLLDKTRIFLSEYGAGYAIGKDIAPEAYYILKIFISIFFAFIGFMAIGIAGAFIGAFIGFNVLKWLIVFSNKQDNEKMLYDIRTIYDTLKIRMQGGEFITHALYECCKLVRTQRLKDALKALYGEIVANTDIGDAIDAFNLKFHNKYIDTFCAIIKQSLESGKTIESLRDMSSQLVDLQETFMQKTKGKLETQIEMIQLLIYAVVVVISIYGLMKSINGITL